MIDNSYYIILNRLKAFANGHYLINTFTYQDEADFDISKNPHYPIMHPIPVSINPKVGGITYNFDIIFADKPRQKENIAETKMNIISDMARCALDLGAEITNGNILFGSDISLDGDISIEPFTDEFANVLTGVRLQIAILVPYDWSACDIPANWVDGTGDIPDFGGRSLTMDIYDEGNFIVAAREMNFVGSGVTVTYTGNRAIVTINGGGGGGSVTSVNGQTGAVVLSASDVGADTSGSAASALTSANSYTDGVVSALTYSDVGADQAGSASAALSSANSYTDSQIASLTYSDVGADQAGAAASALTSANSYTDSQINALDADDIEETSTRFWLTDILKTAYDSAVTWITTNGTNILNHLSNTSNPHNVTKTQVGLGNVDNTSDLSKPISTATQTALNAKEATIAAGTTSQYWRGDKSWQTLDKSAVGLSNVDNTSDLNKPISTATQTVLTRISPAKSRFALIENDFMAITTIYDQLNAAAASSGTQAAVTGLANHPGIVALLDSTTANGGFAIITNNNMLLLAGGEKATFVFQDRNTTTRATAFIRLGFMDSSTNTLPTDGAYAQIQGGVMTGVCRSNNVQTATGTTIGITQNTWYSLTVEVISISLVRFTLFSEAGASLWTQDVTTNIPSATGRETGFGVAVYETTTDAAAQILWLDYLSMEINRTLTR